MNRSIKRGVAASCLLTLVLNLTACGYLLYPERKGQTGGRVDPAVVILDGAALLFGILPGIVAFAVDFTNGTIYLPAGGSSAIDRHLTSLDQSLDQGTDNLQAAEIQSARQVIDQRGEAWIELPLEAITGSAVSGSGVQQESRDLRRVTTALARYTGQPVAVTEIQWVQNLAALEQARSEQFAAVR